MMMFGIAQAFASMYAMSFYIGLCMISEVLEIEK